MADDAPSSAPPPTGQTPHSTGLDLVARAGAWAAGIFAVLTFVVGFGLGYLLRPDATPEPQRADNTTADNAGVADSTGPDPAMTVTTPALTRIVLATNDPAACAAFYRETLGAELVQRDMGGGITFFEGKLAGFTLCLFPAEVAGIDAPTNRHQLGFTVADVRAAIATGLANGGSVDDGWEVHDQGGRLVGAIRDPDGNSIELVQPASD